MTLSSVLLGVLLVVGCATPPKHLDDAERPTESVYDRLYAIPPDELVGMTDYEVLERVGLLSEDNLSDLERLSDSLGRGGYFPRVRDLRGKQREILGERDLLLKARARQKAIQQAE